MTTLTVKASKPYDVIIDAELIKNIGTLILSVCHSNRVVIITDDIVDKFYGKTVIDALILSGFTVSKFVFENGEQSKNIGVFSSILEFLAEQRIARKDTLIALGGGVVGDITGFAASVYMRGIDFIQVPTTLLAAVDASVGGKTAIDLQHGKNLAGAFWQPRKVICDTSIIRELPENIFSNGMGEVIKHGFIAGTDILEAIKLDKVKEDLEWLITRNVEIKRDVVESDECEIGNRRILNFGHTFAHAVEKISDYHISHGVAVGTGMVYETRIAEKLGLCEQGMADIVKFYCDKFNLFIAQVIDKTYINAMLNDKKNEENKIVFALPEKVGVFRIEKLRVREVERILIQ